MGPFDYNKMAPKGLKGPRMAPNNCPQLPAGSYSLSLYMIKALWGPWKGPKQTQNGSRTFLRVYFFILFAPKMLSNGPKCCPKSNTSTLGSHFALLHRICYYLGPKKETKMDSEQRQNVFRVYFFLLFATKMVWNGPKVPPKSTTSTIGSYPVSLHRIWDQWG